MMGFAHKFAKPANARFRVVSGPGGFHVVNGSGQRCSDTFGNRSAAGRTAILMQAEEDARNRRMVRPCLCCGCDFFSEGTHNRMCESCRRLGDSGAMDPVSFGTATGLRRRA